MKKLTNTAAAVAVLTLMVIAALVYISPRFGYRADNVATGSMEPAIMTNSMVVTREVDPSTLTAGDIITFRLPDVDYVTCHRILTVNLGVPLNFTTKGDALDTPDAFPVEDVNVLGKVEFTAPVVGMLVQFLRTKIVLVVGLIIPALFILWVVFRLFWKELVRYIRSNLPKEG